MLCLQGTATMMPIDNCGLALRKSGLWPSKMPIASCGRWILIGACVAWLAKRRLPLTLSCIQPWTFYALSMPMHATNLDRSVFVYCKFGMLQRRATDQDSQPE